MKCPTCGVVLPAGGTICRHCEITATDTLSAVGRKQAQSKTVKSGHKLLSQVKQSVAANTEENPNRRLRVSSVGLPGQGHTKTPGVLHEIPLVGYVVCPPSAPLRLEKTKPLGIGRDKSNKLVLPSRDVSRFHAIIKWHESAYVLEDLESSNGTFVNEDYIDRHVLDNGDKIYIGTHTIVYRELLMGAAPSSDIPDASLEKTVRISVADVRNQIQENGAHILTGDIALIGLLSILQMLGMDKKSGCLGLSDGQESASIYIQEGVVIHTVYGNLSGRDAFMPIAGWKQGQFEFRPVESPQEITMSDEIEWLLLEAMRTLDEQARNENEGSR